MDWVTPLILLFHKVSFSFVETCLMGKHRGGYKIPCSREHKETSFLLLLIILIYFDIP